MVDRGAPITTGLSGARTGRPRRPVEIQQSNAPAALDRLAPKQSARRPVARQRPRRDGQKFGGEVSFRSLPLWSAYSITSSARARRAGGTSRPSDFAVLKLMTSSNLVGC